MFVQPHELSEDHIKVHILDQRHKADVREIEGLMLARSRVMFGNLVQVVLSRSIL